MGNVKMIGVIQQSFQFAFLSKSQEKRIPLAIVHVHYCEQCTASYSHDYTDLVNKTKRGIDRVQTVSSHKYKTYIY